MPINSRLEHLNYSPKDETLKDDLIIIKRMTEKFMPLVKSILDMYSCNKCGWCCREEKVSSGRKDFERLIKYDENLLRNALDEIKGNIFTLKTPCAYLDSNNRCKCYRAKPSPCNFYPFVFLYGHFISISYCPYGTKIINDITEFIKTEHPSIQIQNKEESSDKRMLDVIDRIDNFHKDLGVTKDNSTKIMNVPYEILAEFYIWLKRKRIRKNRKWKR